MRTYLRLVILGVVAIAFGRNANALPTFSFVNTADGSASAAESQPALADERLMPALGAAPGEQRIPTSNDRARFMPESTAWLNSARLSNESLRGKVVLVDFWTYSCINSLRNLPYVKAWAAKYKDAGLVVIGVHTPEFAFEKERANVEGAARDLKVTYPVPIDSNYMIWQAFNNEYWPADYLIDGKQRIRYHNFGEGNYGQTERVIQQLLKDNGAIGVSGSTVHLSARGVEAPPSNEVGSPETYVGYRRAERLASPERVAQDARTVYSPPARPSLNQWGLSGPWNVGAENAALVEAPGKIVFRFHARDLHMVLGPAKIGTPVRFKVKLDDAAPSRDFGVDSGPDGAGEIRVPRLYQLIRQTGQIHDRTFEIEFLDPGVHAYAFTFG
ncbi:MAG: cytochrome biosis protein [Candidatus Eremiobacteraeota bacterium]|nr:cytochrome biosis protein [Candidatus Eremiobacteraeota bacterium]